jgi:hypothetical protein
MWTAARRVVIADEFAENLFRVLVLEPFPVLRYYSFLTILGYDWMVFNVGRGEYIA